MNSNQIAWGIVKAVIILALLFFIGLPIFGVSAALVLIYLSEHWRELLIPLILVLGLFGIQKLTLQNPAVMKAIDAGKGLRILFLYLAAAAGAFMALIMVVIKVFDGKPIDWLGLTISIAVAVGGFYYMFKIAKAPTELGRTNSTQPKTNENFSHSTFNFEGKTWAPAGRYEALYCEKCRKKIGMYGWKNEEHFICSDCHKGLNG